MGHVRTNTVKKAAKVTHLMGRLLHSQVRGISVKFQEQEREHRDNYVPDVEIVRLPKRQPSSCSRVRVLIIERPIHKKDDKTVARTIEVLACLLSPTRYLLPSCLSAYPHAFYIVGLYQCDFEYDGFLDEKILNICVNSSKILQNAMTLMDEYLPHWFPKETLSIAISNVYYMYSVYYQDSSIKLMISSFRTTANLYNMDFKILLDGEILKLNEYSEQFDIINLDNMDQRPYRYSLKFDQRSPSTDFPSIVYYNGSKSTGIISYFNKAFLKFLNYDKPKTNEVILFWQSKFLTGVKATNIIAEKYCLMVPTSNAINVNLYVQYPFKTGT
uniref:Uncharacterized protein n=1 Tax=Megaselia scalaris TaxID=36166 RepID=T1GSN0_MEGSC